MEGKVDRMFSADGTPKPQNNQIEELLNAHANALLAGVEDFSPDQYPIDPAQAVEAADLLRLATRLRETLAPVVPSEEFTQRLKNELVGTQPVTLLVRWRKLPAHYQLAAKVGGLTLTAGIMLLAARRAMNALEGVHNRNQPDAEKGLTLNTAS